ncbi:MAG: GAF domain-containing protein, partial [Alphaproteobacteria bacterium]|nr:GAF domain-containing protein [Alphaproteobacteria bacterium]
MNIRSEIERLQRQQGALADFGTFAFREDDLQAVLTEAARICAQSLDVPFAKVCRYRPEEDDLLVVAGCGWHDVVGKVVSRADETSTQGRAFVTGEPVILEDINKNNSYALPPFYAEHSITSTADVLIQSKEGGSWGVLEADSTEVREFDQHDIVFLTGFANVIAEAVVTSERTVAMRGSIDQMTLLIAEKDTLLAERERREKDLRELQSELLHVSRLNAMGQMTAAIAHELNQPLAAIANYVGAAKLTLASTARSQEMARAQEMIDKAGEQTVRAGGVIKKLRDMVE